MKQHLTVSPEIAGLLRRRDTVKALATVDDAGVLHLVYKGFADVDEAGRLVLLELIETSVTNSNLVHSLWFGRRISLSLLGAQGQSFEISGRPYRCIISGAVFERYYKQVRAVLPDGDLAAVWLVDPVQIKNIGYDVRKTEEEAVHPLIAHLDKLVAQD